MKLNAFNLWPGAVLARTPLHERTARRVSVVGKIELNLDLELAYGRFRSGEPFAFDFNHDVEVVGNVVEYADSDDQNYGVEGLFEEV